MKTVTIQSGSRIPPENNQDTLALIISCPGCNTQRGFRINDSFAGVLTRKSSGMKMETSCSKCQRKISVMFAWTKRRPGWTAQKIELKEFVSVEDDIGLEEATN